MKLSLKTAVFTRCLGENTVAWTISRRGHQYGEWGELNVGVPNMACVMVGLTKMSW